jgi:hypothetical protein
MSIKDKKKKTIMTCYKEKQAKERRRERKGLT